MPTFYLKQPNGLYACFSSIPDDFTAMGLTREQALAHAHHDLGEEGGRRKIERADADGRAEAYDPAAPEGLRRWHGCLDAVFSAHGFKILDARRAAGEVPVSTTKEKP